MQHHQGASGLDAVWDLCILWNLYSIFLSREEFLPNEVPWSIWWGSMAILRPVTLSLLQQLQGVTLDCVCLTCFYLLNISSVWSHALSMRPKLQVLSRSLSCANDFNLPKIWNELHWETFACAYFSTFVLAIKQPHHICWIDTGNFSAVTA